MSNVLSIDLTSRELYELSGWEPASGNWLYIHNNLVSITATKPQGEQWKNNRYWPVYELGYLMRKLAEVGPTVRYVLPEPYDAIETIMKEWHGKYIASTMDMRLKDYPIADAPEDALAKLAIALIEKGAIGPSLLEQHTAA